MTDPTTERLAELFLHTAKRIRRDSAHHLAPLGITPAQARALRTVAHAPQPLRMADLAAQLGIVPRSATTVVDDLEAAGLLRRRPDDRDRRSTIVELTDDGDARVRAVHSARHTAAEDAFSRLTPEDRAELLRLLTALDAAHR